MSSSTDERLASEEGEALVVWQWRLEQALELKVPQRLAIAFADDTDADLNRLRNLVAAGADPELAARIVL